MIRKVTVDDYEAIAKLLIKTFRAFPWNEEWDYYQALQRVKQSDDGKYTRCYVYLINNKIVGVMCGKIVTYVEDVVLMIEDFYVDLDYQRMGIGGKMLTLLEKEINEVDSFMLLTGKGFYSVDFYQKNGFVIQDDVVFMSKKIH